MYKKFGILAALLLLTNTVLAQVHTPPGKFGGSGGGFAAGSPGTGCTAYSLVFIDGAGNLKCDLTPINGSLTTAGRSILTIRDSITGASTTSNWLNITGTLPATLTTSTYGALIDVTADNDTQAQAALSVNLNGVASNGALFGTYSSYSTTAGGNLFGGIWGTSLIGGGSTFPAVGVYGNVNIGIGSKYILGVGGAALNNAASTLQAGGYFVSGSGSTATKSFAVIGAVGTDCTGCSGGWFGFANSANPAVYNFGNNETLPTTKIALVADNAAVAANIFEARDNGTATSTTAASANITILDGAQMRLGNQVLTSSTMNPTIVGEARTATHSYAWTNAMVTALGASLTGDINVATLPAKTQINNAYVVIDTAAGGPATLTVSCGDAIGGTPFTNYVVASDAKAAANTVYGDAVAERGTSIDVEFYYLPSYTATTLVTCHFISSGGNLNTVTTSTGRLILTTTLLP
jgi:hypothetical protein